MTQTRSDRFAGLSERCRGLVEAGRLAGVSTLVWQAGEIVHFDAVGARDLAAGEPIERDTLFRIASMTKPVVSAAALMLVDEGRLDLEGPIARWLPEAADLRVLRAPDGPLDDTEPLQRPPTLFDLMTHTAGFALPDGLDAPITRAMAEAAPRRPLVSLEPDVFARRVCALPLLQQPGRGWYYSFSTDLLGVILARVSGRGLPEFLRERVFDPLGMVDTGFFAPAGKVDRLATAYARDAEGRLSVYDPAPGGFWSRPPAFPSGGAGLISTIDDYLSFARLLLEGGVAGGRRLLSERSVALMTTDQVTAEQRRPLRPALGYVATKGFGLGLGISIGDSADRRRPGAFGWPGSHSTAWFADPGERLIALGMTQLYLDPKQEMVATLETAVYSAL